MLVQCCFFTIWLVYAVRDAGTNHVVIAIDYYKRNIDMFRELVENLGVDVRIETIMGDACKILKEYPDEIDVLFMDVENIGISNALMQLRTR